MATRRQAISYRANCFAFRWPVSPVVVQVERFSLRARLVASFPHFRCSHRELDAPHVHADPPIETYRHSVDCAEQIACRCWYDVDVDAPTLDFAACSGYLYNSSERQNYCSGGCARPIKLCCALAVHPLSLYVVLLRSCCWLNEPRRLCARDFGKSLNIDLCAVRCANV